ncbi:hypothetical protein [Nonomuraea recticatena]|uniref:hypothetical protein n=1 Tax=Nonomuraea recticatena TaxID=46178 RepID=UPI00360978AC
MRAVPPIAAVLTFLLACTIAPWPAAASTAALPGGKATYVVSQGHLKGASNQNWVRLGSYRFSADGTVTAALYLWWQRHPEPRQGTGTTPDSGCTTKAGGSASRPRTCEVLTAGASPAPPTRTAPGRTPCRGTW